MDISVIITSWNGEKILKKNLLKVIASSPEAKEIIVTDDASTDATLSYLKTLTPRFKKLKIISQKKNRGFGYNSNSAVKKAKGDLVALLNNDVIPEKGYLKACLPYFQKKDTFAISFAENQHPHPARIMWQGGFFLHEPWQNPPSPAISAWASGGSAIFNRRLFLNLGGFDELFSPFYWEDVDLGYRAWKSGYHIFWDPAAKVNHRHESTLSRFPRSFLNRVKERNQLLLIQKNISDPAMRRHHSLGLIGRCLLGPNYCKVILSAKRRARFFKKEIRQTQAQNYPLTDRDVFQLFKKPKTPFL